MIILDTNVLSEILKAHPNPQVLNWISALPSTRLFITTVTRGELLYGVFIMPKGKRRHKLHQVIKDLFEIDFANQILGFDNAAADSYAQIAANRKAAGQPISQFDAMIASIAHSRGANLATRNTKDFVNCNISVINPWLQTPG